MFTTSYHSFYYISLLLAALISGFLLRRTTPAFKWLSILVLYTVTSESVAAYLKYSLGQTNNLVYNIYPFVQFVLYAVIYSFLFNSKLWNRVLLVFVLVFFSAGVLNTLFFEPLTSSNTNSMILESLLLVFLSLSLFNKIRNDSEYDSILKESIFWFNCAILLYYPFTILIWGFHSIKVYQLENPPLIIYYINLVFSGLLYLTFTAAIIMNVVKRGKKSNLK